MATRSINEPFITRIKGLIESHMKDEGFGVSELSGEMKVSRSTLHRRIRNETGVSVSQFIRNARLKKTLELLKTDSITVAETAYMTGFRSASYFSKCFRKYFGYPPVEARMRAFDETSAESRNEGQGNDGDSSLLHNFPLQTTSFIGRQKEIETIIGLMGKHRIVTLTGTGGCGKTRLACEAARHLGKDHRDGIWFVDLSDRKSTRLNSSHT